MYTVFDKYLYSTAAVGQRTEQFKAFQDHWLNHVDAGDLQGEGGG